MQFEVMDQPRHTRPLHMCIWVLFFINPKEKQWRFKLSSTNTVLHIFMLNIFMGLLKKIWIVHFWTSPPLRAKHATNTTFVEQKGFTQAPLNLQEEKVQDIHDSELIFLRSLQTSDSWSIEKGAYRVLSPCPSKSDFNRLCQLSTRRGSIEVLKGWGFYHFSFLLYFDCFSLVSLGLAKVLLAVTSSARCARYVFH